MNPSLVSRDLVKNVLVLVIVALPNLPSLAYAKISEIIDSTKVSIAGSACKDANVVLIDSEESDAHGMIVLELDSNTTSIQVKPKSLDRLTCNLALPITLPQGKALLVKTATLVSSSTLPKKATLTSNLEVFALKSKSSKKSKQVVKGKVSNKLVELTQQNAVLLTSQSDILRVNSSLLVNAKSVKKEDSLTQLEMLSLQVELVNAN